MTIKRGFPAHLVVFSDSGKEISGVTTTLNNLADYYERAGQRFTLIDRRQVKTLPNPLYPAMPFGLCNPSILEELLVKHDALPTPETAWHVHTEGPIGVSALLFAHDKQLSITTAFTTRFEEYLSWIPKGLCWYALRKFHNASCVKRTLAPTETMKKLLIKHGFDPGRLGLLSRGPSDCFVPAQKTPR